MSFFTVENPFKQPGLSSLEATGEETQDSGSGPEEIGSKQNTWNPPVDILEGDTVYVFKADLPGLKARDIRVTRTDGMLRISGERNQRGKQKMLRQERSHGYFCRRLPLPDNASREEIHAKLSDGVLQVSARKTAPGRIEVDCPEHLEIPIRS